MKQRISLRVRVTLVCGVVLAICCLLLTLSHNYYAYEMADAIEALPLQPAQAVENVETTESASAPMATITYPARAIYRTQSLIAMGVIVAAGCVLVYWLTGNALAPLRRLDRQIRVRTAADLDTPLPVPSSGDEIAGLTVSFNEMSGNLSKAFAQQKRFSQCAAHELKTPLSVLKTRMALFRKKGLCNTPEVAALLEVLEEQTDRLSQLVNDLLALTNLDSLEHSVVVKVDELLSRAVESLQIPAREHQITLHLRAEPCTVLGNSTLLERAVCNLIENAIKYNRPNGIVTVEATAAERCVNILVTDEGIGIPEELQEQIFEPFFRVDRSRSRQLGGSGLGLSLVRAIAELHHGTVSVEPAPGQGSRFVLTIPCDD